MKTFGDQLKEARKDVDMTQEHLSRRSNTSLRTITRVEANTCDPTLATVLKLVRTFPTVEFKLQAYELDKFTIALVARRGRE
jgi:predicted transcriptional regulator